MIVLKLLIVQKVLIVQIVQIDMGVLIVLIDPIVTEALMMTIVAIDMEVLMIMIMMIATITVSPIVNLVIIVLMVQNVYFIITKMEDRDLKGGRWFPKILLAFQLNHLKDWKKYITWQININNLQAFLKMKMIILMNFCIWK